ncbi:MAG: hypothetical protein AB8B55_24115 [Mariniblastus sp.]
MFSVFLHGLNIASWCRFKYITVKTSSVWPAKCGGLSVRAEFEACLLVGANEQSDKSQFPDNQLFPFMATMAFFSTDKLKRRKIVVDQSSTNSQSPDVQARLNRIEENYDALDSILAELESKIQADERLKAIDDANVDFEGTFGIKKKRKWKTPKPKSKSRKRKSAGPNKPR